MVILSGVGVKRYNQRANLLYFIYRNTCLNHLSPHDALKNHFTALKTDLIFLQPMVLE